MFWFSFPERNFRIRNFQFVDVQNEVVVLALASSMRLELERHFISTSSDYNSSELLEGSFSALDLGLATVISPDWLMLSSPNRRGADSSCTARTKWKGSSVLWHVFETGEANAQNQIRDAEMAHSCFGGLDYSSRAATGRQRPGRRHQWHATVGPTSNQQRSHRIYLYRRSMGVGSGW